ncbi:MAG: bifunctional 5,10-methylenetetrahydrofolate dehydrogenase/5,10-methenyltetrahydrofolate cyclohydrolase [Patescibacteria group bacterium]|nr:bifunctional 5,10-methylenetetrahydrofolate dehydrogenase/5,10-methenyltetrahydrofolate cyclohydrolase [Patescibacteria group bacterium]
MIIDGRTLAGEVLARAKARAQMLPRAPRILAIVANDTPATKSYLAIKKKRAEDAGCVLEELHFDAHAATTEELRSAVIAAEADAVIVQLPLGERTDARIVCDAIPLSKDADVLSTVARMKFEADEHDALIPPVAGAVAEILGARNIDPAGKRAVVIGSGWLVGKPCATWLSHKKADVTHLSFRSGNVAPLREADIVVSGVGSPHFIKPEMLKPGAVLIDAGTSESGGTLAGDADSSCAPVCTLFTPVPGGVGPIAVAKLFENAVALAERTMNT